MVMPSFASPWAPEEAARYEVELSRLLALADGRTRREHYHRMGVRESARAQVAERTRAKAAKAEAEHDRAGTGGAQCDETLSSTRRSWSPQRRNAPGTRATLRGRGARISSRTSGSRSAAVRQQARQVAARHVYSPLSLGPLPASSQC